MSVKLWLSARTPYAMRPSSIEFMLRVCNLGPEPVRGIEPDGMCLETSDDAGEQLLYGPSPSAPREIEVPPQSFHTLIKIASRASGSPREVGVYQVRCRWQGAVSNLVTYRVLGDRTAYVATMRAISATAIEVTLVNSGAQAIEWSEPCSEADLTLHGPDGARLATMLADDVEVTGLSPGAQAVLRFEAPGAAHGMTISGQFLREPFASGTVALVL